MKTSALFVLISLLICVFLAACGPSQAALDANATQVAANIFATQTAQAPTATSTFTPSPTPTATPSATPTAIPTRTPTPTPTPKPGLSAAVLLTLDDLPSGFEVLPREQLAAMEESFPKGVSGVGFIDNNRSQLAMGIHFPATTRSDQAMYDKLLPQFAELFAGAVGAGTNSKSLRGLDDIGEARTGTTWVSKAAALSLRWDIVAFRRGEAVMFLVIGYPDGDKPAVPIHDLAHLLDERISKFLASNP